MNKAEKTGLLRSTAGKGEKRGMFLIPWLLFFLLSIEMMGISWAVDLPQPKRLHRQYQNETVMEASPCIRERIYREEDYLAALSNKQLLDFEKAAEQGDADAMYLLSLVPRELDNGEREYPYREKWLGRAAAAGHPIARFRLAEVAYKKRRHIAQIETMAKVNKHPSSIYLHTLINGGAPDTSGLSAKEVETLQKLAKEFLAEDNYTGKPLTDENYLGMIEAAALAQGSGDLAWRLANAYQGYNPEDSDVQRGDLSKATYFVFLHSDPGKALFWARIAAEKGHIEAAELLCTQFYYGNNSRLGIKTQNGAEAARWCTLAAHAMCSIKAPLYLSNLYKDGIGVPKSALDALFWRRIDQEHDRINRKARNKFEYIVGNEND